MRTYFKILFMNVLLAAFLSATATAEPVEVQASPQKGYGRIVFNRSSPVSFTASTQGRRLTVRFNGPIEASYDGVVQALAGYLAGATAGADGRSVIFNLRGDFQIRSFNMGAAAIVDIIGQASQAPAPKPAQAETEDKKPQTAFTATRIKVRTGVHEGYTRIVFDWPGKVDYTLSQNGGEAVISFDQAADVDLGPLQKKPPKLISGARSSIGDGGLTVTLMVPETSKIKHFISGPKVVVDVMKPTEAAPAPAPAAAEQQATNEPKKPAPAAMPAAPVEPAAIPPTSQTSEQAPEQDPEQSSESASEPTPDQPVEQAGKPTALTPPARTAPEATPTGDAAALTKKAVAQDGGGSRLTTAKPPSQETSPAAQLANTPAPTGEIKAIGIKIDWDEPVAAAVFRRVGYLWVIFDKAAKMNVAALRKAGGNVIRYIEQIPSSRATILRMVTVTGINPNLRRAGLAWILEFRQQPEGPKTAIEATPQPNSPIGARLFLPVTEPGNAIAFTDPEVGDSLIVVPVIPLGYGIANAYEYPQAHILPSSQGLVIQPTSDDLRVRPLRQGVELTSASGLQLSSVTANLTADLGLGLGSLMRSLTRIFDFEKWRQTDFITFNNNKRRYEMAAAVASKANKEKARMDLVRVYFSNGFAAEALGVMEIIAESRPEIVEDKEFLGIRGASNLLMGRLAESAEDFSNPLLDDNDEARFWRAVLRAYGGDLFGAAPDLRRTGAITRPYPNPLKIPLNTLIAEAAIELGDIKQATRYMETVRAIEPNAAQLNQLEFVDGRLKELSGDFDGAVGMWEVVQEGPHRPSRAKAAIARTELLLKLKKISKREAAEELEKLRFAWRGDAFEFNLLRRLGTLYIDIGDYRNGLRTLRQAATHFRDYEEAPDVTQQMTEAFDSLYLDDVADELSPVTAIALYDEFKELTPPGEKGDEMIRKLADRLVDVDLLDRATRLLQGQVEFRLEGLEKSRVGTQLALIHIIALEYDEAIGALDGSEGEGLPEELIQQRRHLRARALIGLYSNEEALALLDKDKSIDAELLRTEIFWGDKDWVQAGQTLRRLIRLLGARPDQPVNDLVGRHILNLAIAETLARDERGIDRLMRDYGVAMEQGPFRDAFQLIASPETLGLISYRSIAGKVADVENFQSFMAAYRERLKERKLSAIN